MSVWRVQVRARSGGRSGPLLRGGTVDPEPLRLVDQYAPNPRNSSSTAAAFSGQYAFTPNTTSW
jgi:hypothetical protein